MKKILNKYCLFIIILGLSFNITTSCKDDNDDESSSKIELLSYGPVPVARGGELRFIGDNLDKVTAIIIPDNIEIPASAFTNRTSTLVTLTVPQDAVEGYVVLKTPQGDITTKTPIGYSEPISIAAFAPTTIKPGAELTITGDYLNLVNVFIFNDHVEVMADDFIAQSRKELRLIVPVQAQTGKIAVSNGAEDPIIVYSEEALNVTLPAFSNIAPNPVKAGGALTITGTNLELTTKVILGGNKEVSTFVTHTATQIVMTIPNDTKDGKVIMIPASGFEVESSTDLVMVMPTVSVSPTTVRNGGQITITGTNLDLINEVVFGGGKIGSIVDGGTSSEIVVTIPNDAVDGVVSFNTLSGKSIDGQALTFVKPAISSMTPLSGKPNTNVTITGTDLDLVTEVLFASLVNGTIKSKSATELVVAIPVGAISGNITLKTVNGSEVVSIQEFEVLSNLPDVTGYLESKAIPGQILTIQGTNLLLIKEIIFPDNIYATAYGSKTDTSIEVYVPEDAGKGNITIRTYEGEEGLLPEIFIGGTDPVKDPALLIYSFDEGWSGFTWDGIGGLGTAADGIDGTNHYYEVTNFDPSKYWLFANNFISYASVSKTDHVLKVDIRLRNDISGNAEMRIMLSGQAVNILPYVAVSEGVWSTGGEWTTISIPLSAFSGLSDPTPVTGSEWGMTMWVGAGDFTGMCIDNIRYEKVE